MLTEPDRLPLARLPTPLESYRRVIPGLDLSVKRDDLTGAALSGNKVRKLEYLFAEAKARGARRVFTCGGVQSNHCRATAVAAAKVGMACRLYLRVAEPPPEGVDSGNLRLDRMVGAQIVYVDYAQYRDREAIMAADAGPDDYLIPEGGSNGLGAWGYIQAVDELIRQWDGDRPTAIVVATGSGGTLAGLAVGLARRDLQIPLHGVAVCDDPPYFHAIIDRISEECTDRWSLPRVVGADVSVMEGYVGRGYSLFTAAEMADYRQVAAASGLILDPTYSGKAFRALLMEPERFGSAPLFIHTGGIFGLMA